MFQALFFLFIVAILLPGIGSKSFSAAIEDRPSLVTRGSSGLVLAEDDDDDDTPEGKEEWCAAAGPTGSTNPVCQDSEKQQEPTTPTVNVPAPTTPTVRVPEPTTPTVNVPAPTTPTVRVPEPKIPTLPGVTIPVPNTGVVQQRRE